MALDFAATYKVLVLGDSNVGKTCIVHRYCDERYYDTYISTIGIDFKQKIINLDGTPIKLQIWDTAGQERFRTLTTAYYRGAMGILLMYDVTSLESFNHLSYWLRNIQENASPDVVKVLAANKCDASLNRIVEAERGQKIAENFDMPFFEVSCKENVNIEEAFLTLARRIREQRGRRMNEQIKKTQKEIFEQLEIVSSVATKAPVHPSFQKKLLDIDDEEIIQMWKDDLKQMLDYCKKKIQILKNIEDLSKIVFIMATNIISDTTVLNINFLPKIHVNTIAELPLAKIKFLSQNVYTNGNLNINNYFLLFNAIMEYFGSHIKNNGFLDFYNCLSQLEASNSDLKIMKEYFCELHAKVGEFSSYTQQKPEISTEFQDIDNESLIAYSKLKNVMFMPSPPIQFNSNERQEVHNRLKLTPVEGVHKQLFMRYNKNKDASMMNASKHRQNLVITRINFDDTISSDVEKSPCRRFAQPKTIWTTSKPVGKYSRLFSNRLTQSANRTANCSILSIPSNSKANSTAMNIIGEVSSAELTIDLTMIEKKSTPKRGNKYFDIPEITIQGEERIVQKACSPIRGNLELDVTTSHKPCSPITSPVKNDTQKGRRRSITDLVERYKKLVQKTETTSQLKSVLDEES